MLAYYNPLKTRLDRKDRRCFGARVSFLTFCCRQAFCSGWTIPGTHFCANPGTQILFSLPIPVIYLVILNMYYVPGIRPRNCQNCQKDRLYPKVRIQIAGVTIEERDGRDYVSVASFRMR